MSRPVQGGMTVAALVLIPLLAVAGSDDLRAAFDFTTGVLTLVSLTAAVAWGLLATDRLFLSTRQRLVGQGIHRGAAVASLGFLLLHATVKVSLGHVELLGALIPFGLGVSGTAGLIGFGALAGLLMIVAAATGAMRSAFATPGKTAGRWRTLHALAYPAWCSALIHGLYAGRPPATWVIVMYSLCLVAVAAALCLRLLPRPTKRRIADLITALIDPGALPPEPDPVIRASRLPGAGAPPLNADMLNRDTPPGWGDDDREVLGAPVRPRTLRAPSPPLYEAPPRSSERLDSPPPTKAGPGPGISAAYRAVSRPSDPPAQAGGRWPAPSPAPPARAVRPPHDPDPLYDPEHAYARAQDVPSYDDAPSPSYETPVYDHDLYVQDPRATGTPSPSYGASASDTSPYGTPAYGESSYASSSYTAPSQTVPAPDNADTESLPGPLFPPPAGEPWHAPAGDRP